MKTFSTSVYEHLILPIINSVAPIKQVCWGGSIGLFVGLTPTMGIQMYIVAAIWAVCWYVFRFRFYLPVGVALVWISNPITFLPLYYIFLMIGNTFFQLMQWPIVSLDWQTFHQKFQKMSDESIWKIIEEGSHLLLIDLGLPMLVGSFFVAIPSAVIFYFATGALLTRYRKFKASQANLSYEDWCLKYETSN
ncbi:MAG: DUF2062 domain-containing protein [SAR324 cluster bacterium]|nr:DUF2062 domain-containing protein [SAR324 cluster bacterium]